MYGCQINRSFTS